MTFILYPMLTVFRKSFMVDGVFSVANYVKFFLNFRYVRILLNTFAVAVPVTVISTLFGFVLAYSAVRLKIPGSGLFRRLALFPLIIPPFLAAFGLSLFIGRNGFLTRLLNLSWNVHGWLGIVIVQSIVFIPYVYLTLEGSVQSLDPTMEEVSRDLGAQEFYTFRRVTMALLTPSLLNSALLVFILSMADFGTPMLIGGRFRVLSVSIYVAMVGALSRVGWAAVMGSVLLLPLLGVLIIRDRLIGEKSYITVSGSRAATSYRETSWYIKLPITLLLGVVSLLILLIMGTVVVMSLVKVPLVNYTFTFQNYPELFQSFVSVPTLLKNSIQMSAVAALIGTVVGLAIAYVSVRHESKIGNFLEYIALVPFAIPGTVFGVGYILAFSTGWIALTGTWYILAINVAFHNLPVAVMAGKNQLQQIDKEMEEAARDLGASGLRVFKDILAPLWRPAFYASGIYVLVTGMRTISAVIFLVTPQFNILAVKLLDLLERLHLDLGTPLAVVLVAIVLLIQTLLYQLSGEKGLGL
ncbi:iron ABC transporter permease [Candidatus Bipolaricaulota bacterium]|nr:iron ABC transporter permease [Candidatus Bipolaricaulota bacterium]